MKLKYTLIFISLCIAANISSFGTPYTWGTVTLDSISFRFSEKDIEKYKMYTCDFKNDTIIVPDTTCSVEYPSISNCNIYERVCSLESAFQNFSKYMSDCAYYPVSDMEYLLEGTILLDFVVETDGTISNISVFQSFAKNCEAEVKRIISRRKWFPGKINCHEVPVSVRLQVKFEIFGSLKQNKGKINSQ